MCCRCAWPFVLCLCTSELASPSGEDTLPQTVITAEGPADRPMMIMMAIVMVMMLMMKMVMMMMMMSMVMLVMVMLVMLRMVTMLVMMMMITLARAMIDGACDRGW